MGVAFRAILRNGSSYQSYSFLYSCCMSISGDHLHLWLLAIRITQNLFHTNDAKSTGLEHYPPDGRAHNHLLPGKRRESIGVLFELDFGAFTLASRASHLSSMVEHGATTIDLDCPTPRFGRYIFRKTAESCPLARSLAGILGLWSLLTLPDVHTQLLPPPIDPYYRTIDNSDSKVDLKVDRSQA